MKLTEEQLEPWRAMAAKAVRGILPPDFPEIVVLCGSTRFADAYRDALRTETLAGRIVLSVGLLGHAEGLDMDSPVKAMLDELHLRKIDLADTVLILSQGGYVGPSTRREVLYARKRGKPVHWLEPFNIPPDLAPSSGSDDDPDIHGY